MRDFITGTLLFLATVALAQAPVATLPAAPANFDVLIRNGRIVDGSGNPWFYADLGITSDKITLLGRAPQNATAKRMIDAKGLVVAPGFIDMLGQSEMNLLVDKRAVSKITQGVTTEITGEGGSVAPQNEVTKRDVRDFSRHYHINVDWRDLNGYFRRLERQGSGVNLATYVGAAQVREMVMGNANRAPNPQQLRRMQALVDAAMRQGALGVSSALIYAPGAYAKTEELIALGKVAAKYGGVYASHIRNEGNDEVAALEEAFRVGREGGLPVEIFHLKVAGRQNWGKMPSIVALIQQQRDSGLDITADQYPYIASATSLGASIPAKYHEGGADAFVARLKDPKKRAQIRQELNSPPTGPTENMWQGVGGPGGILVVSVLNSALKKYEGKTVEQIAAAESKDPLDALMDMVIADHDNTGAVYFSMNEDDVRYAMKQPWVSVGTDYGEAAPDGPLSESKSHPRAYGSFARILGRYVRQDHVLTMEQAIRKFTSLPAQRVKLDRRGLLRPGYFADITVFDPEKIIDVATFENPNRVSQGVEYVFVNGVLELDNGRLTGELGGRPLRGPGNQQVVTRTAEKPRPKRNLSHPAKSSVQSHH